MDEILQRTQKLHGFTSEDIEMVVQTNDKQRFALEKDEHGKLKIRANQGHTMEVTHGDRLVTFKSLANFMFFPLSATLIKPHLMLVEFLSLQL